MKVIKNCLQCTKEFKSYDVGERIKNVFCSIKCKANSQKIKRISDKILLCDFCDKDFIVPNYSKKKYCDKICSDKALSFYEIATEEEKFNRLFQKYNKFVIKKNVNECWDWSGATNKGYGIFHFNKKNQTAHRASWIIHNKFIPEKMHVLHKCDNPPCTNPNHLFLGSHKDNMLDMRKKGYHKQYSKLTLEQVLEIKRLLNNGLKQMDISKMFSVNFVTIHDIKYKKTWAHV